MARETIKQKRERLLKEYSIWVEVMTEKEIKELPYLNKKEFNNLAFHLYNRHQSYLRSK